MISNVRKILIFKLCCFGDTVFMTPAIRALKQQFPNARIYYAYSSWVKSMMKYLPDIDGTIEFENVYSKSIIEKISGTLRFIKAARK
jgi:ADP-heptose:LPS heptosyltransferase